MKPSIGRIVHYTLDEHDAAEINGRRNDRDNTGAPFSRRGLWIHRGNPVVAGDVYPAMIVRTWGDEPYVQLQVFLDGNDTHWVSSAHQGVGHRRWSWPERA